MDELRKVWKRRARHEKGARMRRLSVGRAGLIMEPFMGIALWIAQIVGSPDE
jgi:hypothetical protein